MKPSELSAVIILHSEQYNHREIVSDCSILGDDTGLEIQSLEDWQHERDGKALFAVLSWKICFDSKVSDLLAEKSIEKLF